MKKRLKRYTLNEEIIQKILKLMHTGEEAELTILKRDYPNEYDVAEERLTDKLPDALEKKVKELHQPFPYTRDDCERFKIKIQLLRSSRGNWKIEVYFKPIELNLRQSMPSLDITFGNICRAVGAGLGKRFKPYDSNTPFAGGHGPMTRVETENITTREAFARNLGGMYGNPNPHFSTGRLPLHGCSWTEHITPFPLLSNGWLVDRCKDTKASVINAIRQYNFGTRNRVRLKREDWWTPERTTYTLLDFPERMKPIDQWRQGLELHYEICKPVPALKKLVENRLKM